MLKNLRLEKGMSQRELALHVDCSKYNIIKIEQDLYMPNLGMFLAIIEVLGVDSLDEFFYERGDPWQSGDW